MAFFQHRGERYPITVVSTNDFAICAGKSIFFGFRVNGISNWDTVYVTPEGRMVNYAPSEIVAQVYGSNFYVPLFNHTMVPQTIDMGELIFNISPVRDQDFMGDIVYAYGSARM